MILDTANKLFSLMRLDPIPRVDRVELRAAQVNLAYFTPQERKWIAEAEAKEKGKGK